MLNIFTPYSDRIHISRKIQPLYIDMAAQDNAILVLVLDYESGKNSQEEISGENAVKPAVEKETHVTAEGQERRTKMKAENTTTSFGGILNAFNPDDPEDLKTLRDIESNPDKIYWFESVPTGYVEYSWPKRFGGHTDTIVFHPNSRGNRMWREGWPESTPKRIAYEPPTDEELIGMMRGKGRYGENHTLYAIRGLKDIVTEEEVGKVQGFVRIFEDEPQRKEQLKQIGVLTDEDTPVYVIEYASKGLQASGHNIARGQISLGVRAAVERFKEEHPGSLLVAYVIDRGTMGGGENERSMAILKKAGFVKSDKGIRYDDAAEVPDILFYLPLEKG